MSLVSKLYRYVAYSLIATVLIVVASSSCANSPYDKLENSVFKLVSPSGGGGTAFLVKGKSGKAVLMSNWHVCLGAVDGRMVAVKQGEFEILVKVLELDAEHDLCVLTKVPGPALEVGEEVEPFAAIYTMGHPFLNPLTPSQGFYVQEVKDTILMPAKEDMSCLEGFTQIFIPPFFSACAKEYDLGQTTVPAYPGNSGSPMVDKQGLLIGVLNSTDGRSNHAGFIPLRFVKRLLERF